MAEYALPQLPTLFGVEDALFEEGDLPEDQLIQRQQDAHRRRVAAIFEAYQDSPTPEGTSIITSTPHHPHTARLTNVLAGGAGECDYRIEFRSSSKVCAIDSIGSDTRIITDQPLTLSLTRWQSRDFIDSNIEVQLFGSAFYSQVHTITCSMMAKNISIVSNGTDGVSWHQCVCMCAYHHEP